MNSSRPTYVRSTATNKKYPTDLSTPTYVRSAGGTKQNPHPATNKQNRSGRVSSPLKKMTAGGRRQHYRAWTGTKTHEETYKTNENVKTFNSYSSSSSDTSFSSDEETENYAEVAGPTYVRSAGGTKQNPHPPTNRQNRSGRVFGPLKKVTAGGGRQHYQAWMGMPTLKENAKTFHDGSESYSSSSSDTSSSAFSVEELSSDETLSSDEESVSVQIMRGPNYEYIDHRNDVYGARSVDKKPRKSGRSKQSKRSRSKRGILK